MEAQGVVGSHKKISDPLMQPIRTIWKIMLGDHPGIIPVEFGEIPISGSR